jgi:hypothetical protein
MARLRNRQAVMMKRHKRKQWTGFWILFVMVISAVVVALVYMLTS